MGSSWQEGCLPDGHQLPLCEAIPLLQVKPKATAKPPLLARRQVGDKQGL